MAGLGGQVKVDTLLQGPSDAIDVYTNCGGDTILHDYKSPGKRYGRRKSKLDLEMSLLGYLGFSKLPARSLLKRTRSHQSLKMNPRETSFVLLTLRR